MTLHLLLGSADTLNGMINVMKIMRNSEIFKQIKIYQQHDSKVSIFPPNLPLQVCFYCISLFLCFPFVRSVFDSVLSAYAARATCKTFHS